jgi:hypothetical protein
MSEWSQSLTLTKMWAEVSSSAPHVLQVGLLLNPIRYRCLLRVWCSVRRPKTTLHCVLLEDSNQAFVVGLGLEINSSARLWVLQGPRHSAKCWLSNQRLIFFYYYNHYYLTAIWLTPGGSSTHLHKNRTQNTEDGTHIKITKKEKKFVANWDVRAVSRLCELHPGICLTTKEKAWKTLS